MSVMVGRGLRNGKQERPWKSLVGFTLDDLIRHLERQFSQGMSWENIGAWHVDHITPLSAFKYQSPDDPEFRAAWALTNLRPLWGPENIAKGNRRIFLL
jgi:hypothetical protein